LVIDLAAESVVPASRIMHNTTTIFVFIFPSANEMLSISLKREVGVKNLLQTGQLEH